jgi:carboxypeptidase C (cathepsin A)
MPLKSATGEVEAHVFYMAYTLDQPDGSSTRPLMFSFNGGPGSSSVWLHLGALGPRRVKMNPDGSMPAPPFQLVDNPHTWLALTDLVFIDPVGTGYSRATKPELAKKFWSVEGDIIGVGEFIRLYITRNKRWNSPLYLVGESYGSTRAAGLSGHLAEMGIALNGVILVSTVLNFQTIQFNRGNDLPFVLFLPTYTATAWFHKRLSPELQALSLDEVLIRARQFAFGPYLVLLQKGDAMTLAEAADAAREVAKWTGLDPGYVTRTRLRPNAHRFFKELLRDRGLIIGRFDSRYTGVDEMEIGEYPEFDPSYTAVRPPYTAVFNHYVTTELGWTTDVEYNILGGVNWEWGPGFTDTSDALRKALARNPYLRVLICSGLYDLATPADVAEYTLSHMNLSPHQRARVRTVTYEAGHMMYLHEPSLVKLGEDVRKFLSEPLAGPQESVIGQ